MIRVNRSFGCDKEEASVTMGLASQTEADPSSEHSNAEDADQRND